MSKFWTHVNVHACEDHAHGLEVHGANEAALVCSRCERVVEDNGDDFTDCEEGVVESSFVDDFGEVVLILE